MCRLTRPIYRRLITSSSGRCSGNQPSRPMCWCYPHRPPNQALAHTNCPRFGHPFLLSHDHGLVDRRCFDRYVLPIRHRCMELTPFTGGQLRSNTKDNKVKYGDWDPNAVRCHTTPFIRIPDRQGVIDFRYLDFQWYRLRYGRAHPPCHVNPTLALLERSLTPL